MVNKIELGMKDLTEKIRTNLIEIREFAKKIEILEEERTENASRLMSEKALNAEETLPKNTRETIIGILEWLRQDPHYLVVALARGGWLGSQRIRHNAKVSRIVILALFRPALPSDTLRLVRWLRALTTLQFRLSGGVGPFLSTLTAVYAQ